jgi:hypothetical protein
MSRHVSRNLALALTLVTLTIPGSRALAAIATPTIAPPLTSASPPPTPSGVTGTDPEPIEPDLLEWILSVISVT